MEDVSDKFLQELSRRFPRLFQKKTWVEYGSGWYPMILELSEKIENLYDSWGMKYEEYPYVVQMKEKFGGLRFYMSPAELSKEDHDSLYKIIDEYERKSYGICESCSRPGENKTTTSTSGWYRTLCDSCREEDRKRLTNNATNISN